MTGGCQRSPACFSKSTATGARSMPKPSNWVGCHWTNVGKPCSGFPGSPHNVEAALQQDAAACVSVQSLQEGSMQLLKCLEMVRRLLLAQFLQRTEAIPHCRTIQAV
jgi:hypothetical protein